MKGIKNICLKLTDEERELHKDLIEECVTREEQIKINNINMKQSVNKLIEICTELAKDFETLKIARDQITRFVNSSSETKHQFKQTDNEDENRSIH